MLGNT